MVLDEKMVLDLAFWFLFDFFPSTDSATLRLLSVFFGKTKVLVAYCNNV